MTATADMTDPRVVDVARNAATAALADCGHGHPADDVAHSYIVDGIVEGIGDLYGYTVSGWSCGHAGLVGLDESRRYDYLDCLKSADEAARSALRAAGYPMHAQ